MGPVRKCSKCGFELTDASAPACPVCGTKIVTLPGSKIWVAALIQLIFGTTFMLVFRFPKFMIAIFGVVILIGTALSAWAKTLQGTARQNPPRPVSNPVRFKILSLGVSICSLAFLCFLLFGFVIFIDSSDRWHRYEGQPYHRADFEVEEVYYQKEFHGHDVFARGTVEGQSEWMTLGPYLNDTLHEMPHSEAELDEQVPVGTTIPIYLFPKLKGRSRLQLDEGVPPAEAYHRTAMKALNYGLLGVAISAGMIFVLSRLRRMCFVAPENSDSTGQLVAMK